MSKHPAAVALGKLGGVAKSAKKTAANRRNGRKGGWPKGRLRPSLCSQCQMPLMRRLGWDAAMGTAVKTQACPNGCTHRVDWVNANTLTPAERKGLGLVRVKRAKPTARANAAGATPR